ncbi:RagB/SusD family nutrient uptake outer membrane protein [Maribacter chungangensis]|uniref:RagB/SusD family nutrient uptake outer membrane protein n=1 Tax=Maribacter chungangensis TaxID=1069117 RepID=A0ABW3B0D4_9FLAO
MKNSKYLLIGLAIALFGCNDAIDIDQPGRLDAGAAFTTVSDLNLGLLGLYNEFDITPEIQFNAVFTDELSIGFDNGGQGIGDGTYGFILNPNSAIARATWFNYNDAINAANRILAAAETIPAEANYNDILGQTYALRAFAYFQLISYYSTDYTDDSALATILYDFVPTPDQQLPRSTNAEVFAFINSDLEQAQNLLTEEANATFVSQDFVTALRARMAAYRGNYTQASEFASELLEKYPLADKEAYKNVFQDEDNTGVIFKLERTINDDYDGQGTTGSAFAGGWAGANFAFVNSTIEGSPYFEIGRSLFNLMDEDDVRYEVNVEPTSVISADYVNAEDFINDDILIVGKYQGNEKPLLNDLKVFRIAEMLLINAEALADAGNLTGAAELIKELRDARFGTAQALPSYANSQEAFNDILTERRIEFAFEGHRWKDIKRLGERAGQGIVRDPLDCAINDACSLSPPDSRFTLPIPIDEIAGNSNIQQNPGY